MLELGTSTLYWTVPDKQTKLVFMLSCIQQLSSSCWWSICAHMKSFYLEVGCRYYSRMHLRSHAMRKTLFCNKAGRFLSRLIVDLLVDTLHVFQVHHWFLATQERKFSQIFLQVDIKLVWNLALGGFPTVEFPNFSSILHALTNEFFCQFWSCAWYIWMVLEIVTYVDSLDSKIICKSMSMMAWWNRSPTIHQIWMKSQWIYIHLYICFMFLSASPTRSTCDRHFGQCQWTSNFKMPFRILIQVLVQKLLALSYYGKLSWPKTDTFSSAPISPKDMKHAIRMRWLSSSKSRSL